MDVKVLDGGFSTQLAKYVGDKIDGDPLWTARFLVTNPEAVLKTHLAFLEAGSDIIETNTYQASISGFMKHLNVSKDEALSIILKAAEIAKDAVSQFIKKNPGSHPIIAGSIGPYGAALNDGSEYTGSYNKAITEAELIEWHLPRINVLINTGITTLAFETIPSLKEALALSKLIKDFPNVKCWISFSCKDDQHLSNGEDFQKAAVEVYNSNPDQVLAVGVNCLNPNYVENLFKGLKIPLIVYPNSGECYSDFKWVSMGDIPPIHAFVDDWVKLGVKYIGGCCRTTAEDIQEIKKKIDKLN